MRHREDPSPCAYCGASPEPEDGIHYRFECPTCYRPGCYECVPCENNCECHECEQGILDDKR